MDIEKEMLDLVRIVTSLHRRVRSKSPGAGAKLDQTVMQYRQLMRDAGLDPSRITSDDFVDFLRLIVVYFNIVDAMHSSNQLASPDHLNCVLAGNEVTFAVIASFCPGILDTPEGYWGDDDFDVEDFLDDFDDEEDEDEVL